MIGQCGAGMDRAGYKTGEDRAEWETQDMLLYPQGYSICWFYSCNTSSYIRSVYNQCHVDLLKCTVRVKFK